MADKNDNISGDFIFKVEGVVIEPQGGVGGHDGNFKASDQVVLGVKKFADDVLEQWNNGRYRPKNSTNTTSG